jgi:soluble lytic murein transglycosylase
MLAAPTGPAAAQDTAPLVGADVIRGKAEPFIPKTKPSLRALTTALSRRDRTTYRAAFRAADRRKWKLAERLAKRARNALPAKVIRWLHLSQPRPGATFAELTAFIAANPGWPRLRALRRNVEYVIARQTPAAEVLAWFEANPPLSGEGKLKLAEILLGSARRNEGLRLLREAWVEGKFPSRQERNILRRYRKLLTEDDHAARLDRLLWDQQRRAARRMMRRVSNDQRALAYARIALMEFAGGVDGAIKRVPDNLKSAPGLIYERLRWRRRKNSPESAVDLLLPPARPLAKLGPRPKKWWVERHILLRKMLAKGRISDAYALARDHGQTDRRWASQAENLAGWIALTHLEDPKMALGHFEEFLSLVRYPVSISRGYYWLGRTWAALGDIPRARSKYLKAARYRFTFYGHLAILALGKKNAKPLPAEIQPTIKERAAFEGGEIVQAVRLLGLLKQRETIQIFLNHLSQVARTPGEHVLIARLAIDVGRKDRAVATAKYAARAGVDLPTFNFPIIQVSGHRDLERALQLAVIRQESQFDPQAVSHAGARGLMQLMPATARVVANKQRLRYSRRKLTSDPNYNARLGSAYLASLIDQYKGSYVLALAAYNAGTSRVRRWVKTNGDPRRSDVDPINWVELISISETRNYVQRVLEGLQVFRQRLAGANSRIPLGLLNDLNR